MRLTNDLRESVIRKVLDKVINPKVEKVKKEIIAIAQDTADNIYTGKVKDWIDSAPEGGLHTHSSIRLAIDDSSSFGHNLLGGGRRVYSVRLPRSYKVLSVEYYNELFPVSVKNKNALKVITKHLNSIEKEKEKLESTLKSALWACNTVKQLNDNYPHLSEYLPEIESQSKSLMVTNEDIEKLITSSSN